MLAKLGVAEFTRSFIADKTTLLVATAGFGTWAVWVTWLEAMGSFTGRVLIPLGTLVLLASRFWVTWFPRGPEEKPSTLDRVEDAFGLFELLKKPLLAIGTISTMLMMGLFRRENRGAAVAATSVTGAIGALSYDLSCSPAPIEPDGPEIVMHYFPAMRLAACLALALLAISIVAIIWHSHRAHVAAAKPEPTPAPAIDPWQLADVQPAPLVKLKRRPPASKRKRSGKRRY